MAQHSGQQLLLSKCLDPGVFQSWAPCPKCTRERNENTRRMKLGRKQSCLELMSLSKPSPDREASCLPSLEFDSIWEYNSDYILSRRLSDSFHVYDNAESTGKIPFFLIFLSIKNINPPHLELDIRFNVNTLFVKSGTVLVGFPVSRYVISVSHSTTRDFCCST